MRRLLLAFWLLALASLPAGAEEAIQSFLSDVTVNIDASLTVRETITVNAEGREIRRGILRDFPTTYTDRLGQRVRVGFDVLGVKRDGRSEPYAIESISNGKRIRIGDADVFLDSGPHTYEIAYRTTRQLGFFEDFDELYWNVTGNGWTFAIDAASVIIRLPQGAAIRQHHEYTGFQGSTGNQSRVLEASGNRYRAETTRRLEAGEGFTVAVAWQKGIVAPPSEADTWSWWLADNAGLFGLLTTIFLAGLYYLYAWERVGRDPPKGTIIPLFKPPEGVGPAGLRYIWKQSFDDRSFAAALVGLAVKNRLKIIDDEDAFAIERKQEEGPPLTRSEALLFQTIPFGITQLKQANHVKVGAMRSALAKTLKSEFDGVAFLRNLPWFWLGLGLSALGLIVSALLLPSDEALPALMVGGWSAIWWGAILGTARGALMGLFRGRGLAQKLGSVVHMLFLIPFVGAGVVVPVMLLWGAGTPAIFMLAVAAAILGMINLVFFYLLRAPTIKGRALLDQLEGFRMYMTTAEEERLKVLNPPEKTPELFERYLPYALALDCENEWNAKFAAVLAAAAAAGAAAPSWYSGHNWDAGRSGSFTDSLGSSLTSTVSSAATAPGSSSGSGGGGSSGGGGGGGGGSGW